MDSREAEYANVMVSRYREVESILLDLPAWVLSVHLCPLRRRRICPGGTIVIASGAEHRRLSIPKLNRFAGVGVYYGSKQACNEVTKNSIHIKVEMERIARGDLNEAYV